MDTPLPIEELLYEEESAVLDFKSEQYKFSGAGDHQKSELLKDILAFSNSWRRVDAYILIGVKEIKGGRSIPVGVSEDLDDAQLQQFVNSKAQRPITFTYTTVSIDGVKIGVIRIPVQKRPFYLKSDYGKLKKNSVYIRRGSSTEEVSPDEVHHMGRSEVQDVHEVPNLDFEFADNKKRLSYGKSLNLNLTLLKVPSAKSIPDFQDAGRNYNFMSMERCNPAYYRELVKYYSVEKSSFPLSFLLRNDSNKTISDIRVEFVAFRSESNFGFCKSSSFPSLPQSHFSGLTHFTPIMDRFAELNKRSISIEKLESCFRIEIPFEKIQPKQEVFFPDVIYVLATEDVVIDIDITIYADNIPIPIKKAMQIICKVAKADGSLESIEKMHYARS